MIGDDHGNRVLPKVMRAPAKLSEALIGIEQYLGRETSHGHDDFWLHQIDLPVKEGAALADFLSEGIPIVWGPTLEDIGNIDIVARQAEATEHSSQQGPRPADEWQPLLVFFRARRFSDKHPAHGRTP